MVNTSSNLPQAFADRMRQQMGADEYAQFEEALEQPRIVSLRRNPQKHYKPFPEEEPVPWCEEGVYLKERPSFAGDPHIFAGAYYVQEASSMFLSKAIRAWSNLASPIKALDLCASPGGKSTLISSLLPKGSLLVSNELVSKRVGALIENLTRWGAASSIITSNHSADFNPFREYFDLIVVDAPCSGEGMFRKDPKAIEQWSEGLVQSCELTQRDIVRDIMPCLKPGGILIYSTCTYAPQEDEQQLEWLLNEFPLKGLSIEEPVEEWGITPCPVVANEQKAVGYRFYPHKTKGEGFFLAGFKKDGVPGGKIKLKTKKKTRVRLDALPKKYLSMLDAWIEHPDEWEYLLFQDHTYAVPQGLFHDAKTFAANMNVCFFGVKLGRVNGKKFIPDHHLAVSHLKHSRLATLDLNWEQAITYLQKKELNMETGDLAGWVLATYEGNVLGWAKVLPNRINNFYPSELRLKKEFD